MARLLLITGANKGIGFAAVQQLLKDHSDTFVYLGSRSLQRGEAALKTLDVPLQARSKVLQIDVSSTDSVNAAAAVIEKEHGKGCLSGLVCNAGIMNTNLDETLEVNYYGVKRTCEAFFPLIKKGGRVSIVASAAGPMYVAGCSPKVQSVLTNENATLENIEEVIANIKAHKEGYMEPKDFGYIITDMTKRFIGDKTPEEAGMKSAAFGGDVILHPVIGKIPNEARGWYFGSDKQRSPIDKYRSPGDPPYEESAKI